MQNLTISTISSSAPRLKLKITPCPPPAPIAKTKMLWADISIFSVDVAVLIYHHSHC